MLRRRRIIIDEDAGNTLSLGNYLPPGQTSVTTTARVIPRITKTIVGTAKDVGKVITTPISITKTALLSQLSNSSMTSPSLPTDSRITSQLQRLAPAIVDRGPVPLDRMKSIGTVIVPYKDSSRQLLPNTTGDRVAQLAERVKVYLMSKLPNINIPTITGLLSKIKTPLLVTLGVAAVAALVYAGYSIYRRATRTIESNTGVSTIVEPEQKDAGLESPITSEPHVVYHDDIIDIVRGIGDMHNLTSAARVSLITRIRNIAESTDDAAEFVAKVAEIESELSA
jgi:hypothetical protein